MDTSAWRFLSGCLAGDAPQSLFCAAELASAADSGNANSAFSVHFRDRWYRYDANPDWSTVSMAAIRDKVEGRWIVIAIGSRGQVWEMRPKGPIESFKRLPVDGEYTRVSALGDAIVAVGMGRLCLVRDSGGNWTDRSALEPTPADGVIGFTDIAGPSFEDCIAVGWAGEVWSRRNQVWVQLDCPTNANLNAVDVAGDAVTYCVGDGGVLVMHQRGMWTILESGTDEDLLDVCVHDGQVFACSSSAVYRLARGTLVNDFVGDGDDLPRTCMWLESDGAGYLYSIGTHDVFRRSPEGWERLA